MFNSKKANIAAMIVMSIVLISTIGLYFSENSYNPLNIDSKTSILIDNHEIKSYIDDIFYSSIKITSENGFNKKGILWFENGPFLPTKEEYLSYLNKTLNETFFKTFNELNETISSNINYKNINIIFENIGTDKFVTFENFSIFNNETNFFVEKDLKFSYNITRYLEIFTKLQTWNKQEGVEALNNIINSFNASCGASCSCLQTQTVGLAPSNLDENKILFYINESMKTLNSNYFNNFGIECTYKINKKKIEENLAVEYLPQLGGSYCTGSLNVNTGETRFLWDEDSTIIDGNTVSYNNPFFNFLNRPISIPESSINIDGFIAKSPKGIVTNLDTYNDGAYKADPAYGMKQKSEPSVALDITISCIDTKNNLIMDNLKLIQPELKIGYRINVIKFCTGDFNYPVSTNTVGCGTDGHCVSYHKCQGGKTECVLDPADQNPINCEKMAERHTPTDYMKCDGTWTQKGMWSSPGYSEAFSFGFNQELIDCHNNGGTWVDSSYDLIGHCNMDNPIPNEDINIISYAYSDKVKTCTDGGGYWYQGRTYGKYCYEQNIIEYNSDGDVIESEDDGPTVSVGCSHISENVGFQGGCCSIPWVNVEHYKIFPRVPVCGPNGAYCDNTWYIATPGPSGGFSCLTKGTKITLNNGSKVKIETLNIGDSVLSFNELTNTLENNSIKRIESPIRDHYYSLKFKSGRILNLTNDHPIYVKKFNSDKISWSSIDPISTFHEYNLIVSKYHLFDYVLTQDNSWDQIIMISKYIGNIQTYTLHIGSNHNFFAEGLLVHNKGASNPPIEDTDNDEDNGQNGQNQNNYIPGDDPGAVDNSEVVDG